MLLWMLTGTMTLKDLTYLPRNYLKFRKEIKLFPIASIEERNGISDIENKTHLI